MFEIFKRSGIREWELLLLKNILKQLPEQFKFLEEQINSGLFNGILIAKESPSDYVAFSYNEKIYARLDAQLDIKKESNYKITGIRVYDKKSKSQLLYTMYVSNGMIQGYSIKGANSFSLDIEKTDVSWFAQIFNEMHDTGRIEKS